MERSTPQIEAKDLHGESSPATARRALEVLAWTAAVAAIVAFEKHLTFYIGKLDALAAASILALTAVEIATWKVQRLWPLPLLDGQLDPREHPIARRLRRAAFARSLLLVAVILLGLAAEPSEAVAIGLSASLVLLCVTRHLLRRRFVALVPELPEPEPEQEPHEPDRNGVPVKDAEGPVLGPRTDRRVRELRHAGARRLRGMRRVASTTALVSMVAAAFSLIALGEGFNSGKWKPPAHITAKQKAGGGSQTTSNGAGPTSSGGSGSNGGEAAKGENRGSWSCPALEPQKGIPASAITALDELFSGLGKLDMSTTGCFKHVAGHMTPDGPLYYTIGKAGASAALSVAIDSPRFPHAIVLYPAGAEALKLIDAGEDVGGTRRFPRYYARSSGYAYLLRTSRGTVAITRRYTPGAPSSEVAMPVSVSFAWLSAMRESGVWLAPATPSKRAGKRIYELYSADGSPTVRILYDDASETATRSSQSRETYPYAASEPQIMAGELRRWRLPVGREERLFEGQLGEPEEEGDH